MESKPLFYPGFYDVPLEGLRQHLTRLLVAPFTNRKRRELLLDHLFVLLDKLREDGNAGILEVWIDGSFVTEKEEPGDIDIVIVHATGTHVSQELKNHDLWKEKYRCEIHYVEFGNRPLKGFYQEFFGSDRNNRPKGILRVRF